jgi:hypothetical protein
LQKKCGDRNNPQEPKGFRSRFDFSHRSWEHEDSADESAMRNFRDCPCGILFQKVPARSLYVVQGPGGKE